MKMMHVKDVEKANFGYLLTLGSLNLTSCKFVIIAIGDFGYIQVSNMLARQVGMK
jgi:hypothetical protein